MVGSDASKSTPLVASDGRVLGMLSTHWRGPHEPSAAELRRVDALARRCAAAVAQERERAAHEGSSAAAALHEVNQRIREMAAQFSSTAGDDVPQVYLCECGCGEWVALTVSEFDAGAAAQLPVTAHGHVLARGQAARRLSPALRSDAAALRAEALQRRRKSDELEKKKRKPPSE